MWWRVILPLLLTSHFSLFAASCGTGDDDGSRLGEQIVGTWYRDSLVIDDENEDPENYTYHRFDFFGDGNYNGMVREGSFSAISRYGSLIYEGTYKCDNDNLRLEFMEGGQKQRIHAQVLSFTDDLIVLRYENDAYNIGVRLWLRKDSQSSSTWEDW